MQPKKRSEAEVKSQVMRTLRGLGVMAFRMNAGRMQLESKGPADAAGNRTVKTRFVNLAPSGTADILAFVGRFPLWIETKREGTVQTREQLQFEAMVKQMGHHYIVARDFMVVATAVAALRGVEQ